MSPLDTWFNGRTLLTDGAWGTELQVRGLEPGRNPDHWNIEHPDRVEDVARAYAEAGCDVILTNTFRANRIALGEGSGALAVELNRAGVEISRRAAQGRCRVIASLGPSGKMLLAGDVTPEELTEAFAEQAAALAQADALLIETMSDIEEACLALRAALPTGLPVIVSFAFDAGRNKDRTMTGATPEQAAAAVEAAGAAAVGANCGSGIAAFAPLCARLRAACRLPLWIKPNAGLPEIVEGRAVYRTTPAEFASHAPALVAAGAGFLGGCCGSNVEFIRALGAELKRCALS
ncbi:MAG: homocysteine S-methyltransferase family protein [Acidobacteria bacterium]|nr:homocysteine S-methyltransferase family protein [Acidobacteriota bacterium]